jgi:hypothetical protein
MSKIVRTKNGSWMLVVLTTRPESSEAAEFRARARGLQPRLVTMSDAELTAFLIKMILAFPKITGSDA